MRAEYIIQKANEIINLCGGRDPCYAVAQSGAVLKYKDLGSLKGAYFGNMQTPAVVINGELDEEMQKTVCAHELGHHVLHKGQMLSCDNIDLQNAAILEREANVFAAAFLIDKDKALSLLGEGHTLSETAAILETDVCLLMFLLNAAGLTDAPESTYLR